MNEVQFVSDVIYNMINGISDFNPNSLDKLYEQYDEEFPLQDEIADRFDTVFEMIYTLDKGAITTTIFQRQPLIFSLILVLDKIGPVQKSKLEDALYRIDAEYKDESIKTEEVEAFRLAVASSTQRISSRRTRDSFIKARM